MSAAPTPPQAVSAAAPQAVSADLAIVGAGPVGLYGAYYAGVRGLSTVLLDSLPEPGGQVTAMYPEKPIYDIAGFPAVVGRQLVENLVEQAGRYSPGYLLGEQATTLETVPGTDRDRLRLTTATGTVVDCGAVVVTGGIGTFTPRPLPAGEEYLGRGLAYFVPALADLADRDVIVVGGGDSACDWTLAAVGLARSVTLVHRRAAFRAHAGTVEAVHACGATVVTDAQVVEIRGSADEVERVVVRGKGVDLELPAQRVVAALGFLADLGPVREWGLELHDNRHLVVGTTMATARPGVYAAGDIAEYPGKVRLISVGFGEVATAVNNAAVHLDPDAALFPGHSTDAAPALAAVT